MTDVILFTFLNAMIISSTYSCQQWGNSSMTQMIVYQLITNVNILTMFSEDSLSSVIVMGKQSML